MGHHSMTLAGVTVAVSTAERYHPDGGRGRYEAVVYDGVALLWPTPSSGLLTERTVTTLWALNWTDNTVNSDVEICHGDGSIAFTLGKDTTRNTDPPDFGPSGLTLQAAATPGVNRIELL